jgi:cell division transport system permease protein
VRDIRANAFLHTLAVVTICLVFVLAGSFALVFVNVRELIRSQHENVRVMAYLAPGLGKDGQARIARELGRVPGVRSVSFISRDQALEILAAELDGQADLLKGLKSNPLPDAFELVADAREGDSEAMAETATRIQAVPGVTEVNYGQAWLDRFAFFIELSRMIAIALACLLVVASVSITSNTIRLVLYNRRAEIHVMRLVGATEMFIRAPFYMEGALQGLVGSVLALGILFAGYEGVVKGADTGFFLGGFTPSFLPLSVCAPGLLVSAFVGWMGCYLSFRQFKDV